MTPPRKKTQAQEGAPQTQAPSTKVLKVREGRSIRWPNGQIRGEGPKRVEVGQRGDGTPIFGDQPAYAVWADDPFVVGYEHCLEPAEHGTVPQPMRNWPAQYQRECAQGMGAEFVDRSNAQVEQDRRAQTDAKIGATDDELPGLDDIDEPEAEIK